MPLLGNVALLGMWQDTAVLPSTDVHLLTYSVVILAAISLIQFLAITIGSLVAYSKIKGLSASLQQKAQPLLQKTQAFVEEATPKLHTLLENAQQVSYTVRAKVDEIGQTVSQINETVQDTNSKTRSQVSRVNGLVSEALTTSHAISRNVQEGILTPVKQMAGMVAGLKAGFETLAQRWPLLKSRSASSPATQKAEI